MPKVAELFHSVQGEGKLTGVPSTFVRLSGCNLRCSWCDTPYASWRPEGDVMTVAQIEAYVRQQPSKHVVLTGGEPTIHKAFGDLCAALADLHLTVETAGTVYAPSPHVDLWSVSPKLSNSTPDGPLAVRQAHEDRRWRPDVVQRYLDDGPDCQLKFVVTSPADLREIDTLLSRLTGYAPSDVQLMPEGTDAATLAARAPDLVALCLERGFRYCPRLHVALFGNKRGT